MTPREAEKIIVADGWVFDSWAGSHKHYKHPAKPGKVTIPFHKRPRDLKKKTVESIMKQAGIEYGGLK